MPIEPSVPATRGDSMRAEEVNLFLEAVIRGSLFGDETFELKGKSKNLSLRKTAGAKALRGEGGFQEQKGGQWSRSKAGGN